MVTSATLASTNISENIAKNLKLSFRVKRIQNIVYSRLNRAGKILGNQNQTLPKSAYALKGYECRNSR